jgi:CubicO group peptidase (beta-lactamase class C family)
MRLTAALAGAFGAALLLAGSASTEQAPAPQPAAAAAAPTAAHTLDAQDVNAWLDGYMPYALKTGDIAGGVVVVVKDGQVLTERGYGYADVKAQKPVDPATTLFRPGSISKLFTWTAVMQQVEAGKLNLDADINQYLDFKIPPRDGKPVTLRNLMTHEGGFEETGKHLLARNPKEMVKLGPLLKLWVPERMYAPGEVPAYSNYGAALAGYVVQRVSGEPFPAYIERHIFQPLGMSHSTFEQPLPARLAPDMAKGYLVASQPPKPFEIINHTPAGALSTSGDDIAKFMIAHLQDGRYGSVQILKPETARLMHTMQNQPTPPFPGMALGFYRDDRNSHEVLAHGGDLVLFHSDLHLFMKDGVGVYESFNSFGKQAAVGAVRALFYDAFADRYFPAPTVTPLPTLATAKADAQKVVGSYWASRRSYSNAFVIAGLAGQLEVKAKPDGTLDTPKIRKPGGGSKTWREVGPQLWQEIGGKTQLRFIMKNGKVDHFSMSEVPAIEVFQPVPFAFNAGWNVPLFFASCGVLAFLVLLWPVAALVRRRYGGTFALSGRSAMLYRAVRVVGVLDLLSVAGWITLLSLLSVNLGALNDSLDPWLHLLHLLALVGVLGAGLALWNLVTVWRDSSRSWWAKLSSLIILVACLDMAWLALLLHLLGPSTNF